VGFINELYKTSLRVLYKTIPFLIFREFYLACCGVFVKGTQIGKLDQTIPVAFGVTFLVTYDFYIRFLKFISQFIASSP
jgi:hypothetical protein